MLRHQRDSLLGISKIFGVKHYLRVICRITGEQFPVGSAQHDAHQGLALRTCEEFDAAITEAQLWVRGQPDAVQKYLHHVRDSAILRQQLTSTEDNRPLACFLLSGASGIGKSYLARVLGRLIFVNGADQAWELEKVGSDQVKALFGGQGSTGSLLASLSRQSFQTIILENIEVATGPFQDVVRSIMQQGVISDPTSGRQISFRNTILVLTTTRCVEELRSVFLRPLADADRHTQVIDAVSSGTGLSTALLACIDEFVVFDAPDDLTKAEVVSLAMCRECSKYGVRLEYIAPELLVQELDLLGDSEGFSSLEDRVKKMLQAALLEAARRKKQRLVLKAKPVTEIAS